MQRPDVWVSRSRLWAFPPFLKEQGWSLSYCFLLVVCFGLLPGRELNSISSESASVQILVCIYFASHLAVRILLSGPVTHFFCVLICFPLHPTWRWSSSIYIYTVHFKTKTKGPLWSEGISREQKHEIEMNSLFIFCQVWQFPPLLITRVLCWTAIKTSEVDELCKRLCFDCEGTSRKKITK